MGGGGGGEHKGISIAFQKEEMQTNAQNGKNSRSKTRAPEAVTETDEAMVGPQNDVRGSSR